MSNTPSDAELSAFADAFDWDGWIAPALAKRAFARAVLAKWGTPQPVVREPLSDKELANLAKVGAIATDGSGKVVMWPALYRNQMVCRFERGWREAEKYHGITQKGGG